MRWLIPTILITAINLPAATLPNPLAQTRQLVVVSAPSWDSDTGTLMMLSKVAGQWVRHSNEVPVVFGHGLAWGRGLQLNSKSGSQKREGDQRSAAGIFFVGPVFGYAKNPPAGCRLPYCPITGRDYFVDDPNAKEYNQWIKLPSGMNPKQRWRSAEKMLRPDALYQFGIVIRHNMDPIVKGAGSAIFFHVWRNAHTPTVGCTAMPRKDILELIRWLDPGKKPLVIQAPAAELAKLRAQVRTAGRDAQD